MEEVGTAQSKVIVSNPLAVWILLFKFLGGYRCFHCGGLSEAVHCLSFLINLINESMRGFGVWGDRKSVV